MKLVIAGRGSLGRFQDRFARALLDDPAAAAGDRAGLPHEITGVIAQRGFAVYRNTVYRGCIDALQGNYPTVTRLVGEEWLRAAAAIFARTGLPSHPALVEYGAGFAAFLETFGPAAELPYLPGVARLDRMWTEAHVARDEPPLDAAALAHLDPDRLAAAVLRPHASARWAWFAGQPIFTIWSRNRAGGTDDSEFAWQGEGALLVRPFDKVEAVPLDHAAVAFLDASAAGASINDASLAAFAIDAGTDLSQLLARLFAAGAWGQISFARETL